MKALFVCVGLVVAGVLVVAFLSVMGYFVKDTLVPSTAADLAVPVPRYEDVDLGFTHRYDGATQLPMTGAAMIDVDGDGREELFISGGRNQEDGLLRWNGEGFEPVAAPFIVAKNDGTPSYGAASVDADGDGRVDLWVSRGDGITLYLNRPSGFEALRIENHLNEKTVGMSLTLVDLNHDGWVDLFISGYLKPALIAGLTIFTDPTYGGSSRLLLNRGNNTFTDITTAAGLEYVHNTFQAVFVDIDGDLDQDLVVAHDTGEVRTYRNLEREGRPLEFEMVANPTTQHFAYPMGIALGDCDGNGLPDFLFPNTGTTIPDFIARGDLGTEEPFNSKWILFETQPGMDFVDVAERVRVADYEFGWGAVFADMNLDGLQDLIVAENFVDFPAHKLTKLPGRFLLQNPDGTFASAGRQAGAENPHFGISPLVVELNGDGEPDLIFLNLEGPVRAVISQGTLSGDSLTVVVPDIPKFLSAKVVVILADGQLLVDWFVGAEGFGTDQPSSRIFGLGAAEGVRSVRVLTASGEEYTVDSPGLDSVVTVGFGEAG
jgi:hypothetical protein